MAGGWPEQKPADAVAGLSANGAAFPKPSSADPTTSFNQPLDGAAFTSGMGGLDWVGLPEVLERLGPRCWERRLVSRRSLFLRFQAPLWPTGPGLRRCFGRWRGGCHGDARSCLRGRSRGRKRRAGRCAWSFVRRSTREANSRPITQPRNPRRQKTHQEPRNRNVRPVNSKNSRRARVRAIRPNEARMIARSVGRVRGLTASS